MLGFLNSIARKSSDPLTNLGTVSRWMETLPMGDGLTALVQITEQLKEYNDQDIAANKERVAILSALDEGAQMPLETLRSQYLLNPRMSRTIESRIWNSVSQFYQEVMRAYHSHIMEYIGNPSGSRIKNAIPLLTLRAMHYFAQDAKWSYYRYTDANSKLWKRLHNLYHFAEYEEFEHSPLKAYADRGETCITDVYLQALMLETLNTGSLTPRQLYLVDRWLPMLVKGISLDREFKPARHNFYVRLDENQGARRVRRIEPNEHFRFWDTYGLKEKLEKLRSDITGGVAPAKLGLTEDCKLPTCLEMLDRVSYFWSPIGIKRVQRQFERKHVMKSIEVVRGLEGICMNVRADNASLLNPNADQGSGVSYEEMVDVHLYGFVTKRTLEKQSQGRDIPPDNQLAHERWVMENESEGGYGATINDQADDWVRLGKLVGFKPEKTGYWNVGVIRRLRRVDDLQQYVGIEVISDRPLSLMLRPQQNESRTLTIEGVDAVGAVLPIPAIYLKAPPQSGQADALIVQSAEYSKGRVLWFTIKGITYQIRLKQVVDRGDDWLRTSFELISKTTANH